MMDTSEHARIVAKNLKRLAYENEKTQADIAKDLGIKQSTLSSWMTGARLPRMDKIDMLCKYFGCLRVDILEDRGFTSPKPPTEEELRLVYAFRKALPSIKTSVEVLLGLIDVNDASYESERYTNMLYRDK